MFGKGSAACAILCGRTPQVSFALECLLAALSYARATSSMHVLLSAMSGPLKLISSLLKTDYVSCSICLLAKGKKRIFTSFDFEIVVTSSCILKAFSSFRHRLYVATTLSIYISSRFVANIISIGLLSLLSIRIPRYSYWVGFISCKSIAG